MAQRIEQFAAPQDVFQAIVGNAVRLNRNGSNAEDILRELNNNEDLASVIFMFIFHAIVLSIFSCLYKLMMAFKTPVYLLLLMHVIFLAYAAHKSSETTIHVCRIM